MNEFLEAGIITNTHGVLGNVLITSLCDTPEVLSKIHCLYLKTADGYTPFKLEKASVHKGRVLAKPYGINDPETAARYKNKSVYAKREDIIKDEDSFFIADLIGLPIVNSDTKKIYGRLKDVIINAANDVYEIETEAGLRYMPVVKEFVKEIKLGEAIYVLPIEGMFDEI
ncbi:MAG: ribosome maturation factor RimM [Clostridia bacterium]|nr:ribosome maturation factor RimM [Clostridia bacterium]